MIDKYVGLCVCVTASQDGGSSLWGPLVPDDSTLLVELALLDIVRPQPVAAAATATGGGGRGQQKRRAGSPSAASPPSRGGAGAKGNHDQDDDRQSASASASQPAPASRPSESKGIYATRSNMMLGCMIWLSDPLLPV